MTEPRIAKSLDRLRAQVRAAVPNGPPLSEYGWIASAEHRRRSPNSDHNEDALGVVHALDIPHDPDHGLDTYELAAYLRDLGNSGKEPRLKYLISNRRIWNPAISPAWRAYNLEPHDQHVHISVVKSPLLADDPRDWDLGTVIGPEAVIVVSKRPMLRRGMSSADVRLVQQAIMVDGIFGPLTEEAVRRFQAGEELDDDGIVGPLTWRALEFRYPELRQQLPPEPVPPKEEAWQTDIVATVFGGAGDPQRSAYDNHVVKDDEYGVALPYRFPGKRPVVQVHNVATDTAVNAEIVDVGPWNIDDPYWEIGKRPQAESGTDRKGRKTNLAGIDLTPATAKALGIDGKGKVNWRFVT